MDIDFWVCDPVGSLIQLTTDHTVVVGFRWPRTTQGPQTVNRNCVNYCGKGWETRILLLESHELCLGQGRQVCQGWLSDERIPHRSCSFNVHGVIFVGEDGKSLLLPACLSFLTNHYRRCRPGRKRDPHVGK